MQVSIRQAGRELSRLINQAVYGGKHITITSRGKPKAILLSVQEYERLTEKAGPRIEVLEEARRLRETFAARYGVLETDLRGYLGAAQGDVSHRDVAVRG